MKPISKTAFYSCGVRMEDAKHNNSVCGDIYAKFFMNEDGLRILESFKEETSPNATIVARHRIIDDFLRRELLTNPDLCVVLLGAGFDSRAFRLEGGKWLELDEPQIIEYKNERLPVANCRNQLHRIAIDFSTDSLLEKLFDFASNAPAVVVIEGVFTYLEEEMIIQTLHKLRRLFPRHKLIGDLMNKRFFEEYGKTMQEKLSGLGATLKFTADEPEKIFIENGYNCIEKTSIVEKAVEFELLKIPKIALETVLSTLANGNAIYLFEVG
jgi:methyltransferase (TIGR00027 family)